MEGMRHLMEHTKTVLCMKKYIITDRLMPVQIQYFEEEEFETFSFG